MTYGVDSIDYSEASITGNTSGPMRDEIKFLLMLYWPQRPRFQRLQPPSTDENHPSARLLSKRYRAKKRIVRGLWIATGLMMLSFPLLPFMVTLGLFTTFLSFSILDESA